MYCILIISALLHVQARHYAAIMTSEDVDEFVEFLKVMYFFLGLVGSNSHVLKSN